MGTLVDDLFLLAQLDRERPLRFEPVDLADLVRRSVAGIGVSAPDRPVAVDVDRPGGGRRRRAPDPPGGRQPARQRRHPHAGRMPPCRDQAGRGGRMGRAHRPRRRARDRSGRRRRASSSPSSAPTRPGPGRQAVPAWVWPSWPPSSRPTGARSGGCRATGPPSRSGCPSTGPEAGNGRITGQTPWGGGLSRAGGALRPANPSGRDVPDRPLDDLARADARGAGVEPPGRSVHQGPHPLDVRDPSAAWSCGGSG